MNRDEAKSILLLFRSDADVADPQIAVALSFMKSDPDLREWFEEHCARQFALRAKFRQITPPPGLKEQIISERKVMAVKNSRRDKWIVAGALAAIIVALVVIAPMYFSRRPAVRRPIHWCHTKIKCCILLSWVTR